jgi:ankyrin repeat protein
VNAEVRYPGTSMFEVWSAAEMSARARATPLSQAVRSGDLETVRLLLATGADPNTTGTAGWTPLHVAVDHGNPHVVRALLEAGANPRLRDISDQTPRMLGSRRDNTEITNLIDAFN